MENYRIKLSWPDKALWQNRQSHWSRKANAVRAAKSEAWALAKGAKVKPDPRARLEFYFHPPDGRRRDLHNMPATQKAAIDGIAEAMGVDDQHFRVSWPEEWGAPAKGGEVVVWIRTET